MALSKLGRLQVGNLQRLQGLRREGIGTFKARRSVGWQPTEVTEGLQGLRREGIGTFKARTAVG